MVGQRVQVPEAEPWAASAVPEPACIAFEEPSAAGESHRGLPPTAGYLGLVAEALC